MTTKIFKFSRKDLIVRLLVYSIVLIIILRIIFTTDKTEILPLAISGLIYLLLIALEFGYICKDILVSDNKIELIDYSYNLFRFPKKIELPFKELQFIEKRDLVFHGIVLSFITNKTYISFVTDFSNLDELIKELKEKVPKTCVIHQPIYNKERI